MVNKKKMAKMPSTNYFLQYKIMQVKKDTKVGSR
jgi:hypothetical protein